VPAVDGRELAPEALAEVYDPAQSVATHGRELAPGEIGCALSHLRLYRRMEDEGIDEALILEDDAVIHPDALALLERRGDLPCAWEILLLNHMPDIGGRLNRWHSRRLGSYRIGRFSMPTYGTGGYLIRRSAARALLDRAYPIRAPADYWTGGGIAADIRICGVEPPCIAQLPVLSPAHSTIPDRELYWKKWGMPELPAGPGLYLHRLKVWLVKTYHKYHPGKLV
jgi:glycosyl transferase family 25